MTVIYAPCYATTQQVTHQHTVCLFVFAYTDTVLLQDDNGAPPFPCAWYKYNLVIVCLLTDLLRTIAVVYSILRHDTSPERGQRPAAIRSAPVKRTKLYSAGQLARYKAIPSSRYT